MERQLAAHKIKRNQPLGSFFEAEGLSALIIVAAVGVALSWVSTNYPSEMPSWGPWEFSWIEYLGCVMPLCWYIQGVLRTPSENRPGLWRQGFYCLGILSIYIVTQTRFTYVAQHLFMATQVQQFVLHDIGPFFIALSWPGAVLKAGTPDSLVRFFRQPALVKGICIIQHPIIATSLFVLLFVAQVVPLVVFRMMLDRPFFDAMNVLMTADGVIFWLLVLDPRPRPPAAISYFARMALAFAAMVPLMPIGAYIALTANELYGFYDFCGRLDWFSPSTDQSLGGLILWIPGGLMNSIAVLLPLNAMRIADEENERRHGKTFVQFGGRQIDPSTWTGR